MHPRSKFKLARGFSLVELMVVIAIVMVLAAVSSPSLVALGAAGALDKDTSDLRNILAQARTYAMGNDTYVYIGFAEEDANQPGVAGIGRVAVAVVAAQDGTRPYSNSPGPLPASGLRAIARPQTFANLHLTSATTLNNGNMTNRPAASTVGFVDLSEATSTVTFQWPLTGSPLYSFDRVIEFDPKGVARVQTGNAFNSAVPSYIELPLLPVHGTTLPAVAANEAAIQIDGMTGIVRTYRP